METSSNVTAEAAIRLQRRTCHVKTARSAPYGPGMLGVTL